MPRRPGFVRLDIEIHERLMAIIDRQFELSGERSKACFVAVLLNAVTNARIPNDVLCQAPVRPAKPKAEAKDVKRAKGKNP